MLLRAKGETPKELSGMVRAMNNACNIVKNPKNHKLLDIVGTGGDGADTINISTASAVLAAACGCIVAKAGNRSVSSACGGASSATGPFYCPGDEKLYLDLSFFNDMAQKLNAPGDFAQAYVIAHEVGHHIQKLMGTTDKLNRLRGRISETEYNKYSVRLELQADFLAGVWAHHSQQMFQTMEAGDLNEALNAANAIGDDRLQKNSTGRVVPDSFTHGTSEQRMRWFKKGFDTGDLTQGDTFNTNAL